MLIFFSSIVFSWLGLNIGGASGIEVYAYLGGLAGFSLPYAIVIERIYKSNVKNNNEL